MENTKGTGIASLDILRRKKQDGTLGDILEDWKWIMVRGRGYRLRIIFYTLIGILSTTFGLVSAVANKYVIDIVVGRKIDLLWLAILIMAGSALLGLVLTNGLERLSCRLSVDIRRDVEQDIYGSVLNAEWQDTCRFSNGDLLNRFSSDIETVSDNVVKWLPSVIIAGYSFVATFFVIWYYDRTMALIALSGAPVLVLASRYLLGRQRYYGKMEKEYRSRIVSRESETFYNIDTIKSFGIRERFENSFRELMDGYRTLALESNRFKIFADVCISLVSLAVSFAAFGYALYLLWTDAITYGTMVLFLQQRSSLTSAFQEVAGVLPKFVSSSVSAHRIRELSELPAERTDGKIYRSTEFPGGLTVTMEDVSFVYEAPGTDQAVPGSDQAVPSAVLENASLTAAPGEIVALSGSSGEGKTTVLRLLLGIVTPQKGWCGLTAADGQRIRISADTRPLTAYVPQGSSLLSGTIAENLRAVREDASDQDLTAALKAACAWEFVEKLPGGLEYVVGEKGKGLSEGQAQRIAIARAILRDAPVLLLDEATSALDAETERRVLENILEKSPDHTVILTTHRAAVLSLCTRVYRVDGKEIRETEEKE